MTATRRKWLQAAATGLAPFNSFAQRVSDARSLGTLRVPKLKIKEVRAIDVSVDTPTSLKGFEGRYFHYVRVYTDQGLTGTGEMVDTLGAAEMINTQMGPSIAGRDPLDIEAIYNHFWTPSGFGRRRYLRAAADRAGDEDRILTLCDSYASSPFP